MKRYILKIAIGALMFMGSGMALAGLLGASVSFDNESVNGELVSITATPASTTVTGANEFDVCVDGPATACSGSGLKFTIDIGDAGIVFVFTGTTGASAGSGDSFFFDLVFGSNVTITSVAQDLSMVGNDNFVFLDFLDNVIKFQGNDADGDGTIDAGGGVTINFEVTAQQAPAPGALALLGLALAGMSFARRRMAL